MARLSFRCGDELVARVDAARGDVARERWLRRAVERALGSDVKPVSAEDVASAPAPAEQPGGHGADYTLPADGSPFRNSGFVQQRRHAPNCKCPVCS